jgi:hypothetical protein
MLFGLSPALQCWLALDHTGRKVEQWDNIDRGIVLLRVWQRIGQMQIGEIDLGATLDSRRQQGCMSLTRSLVFDQSDLF